MATRGTAILIDEEFVAIGPEFNGDMYPHGNGNDFFEKLSEVNSNTEFIIFNNRFNKYYFDYENIMKRYQGKFENNEIKKDNLYSMDLVTQKSGKWITSDWLFIKNITNKQQKIKDLNGKIININSGETIRLYFGKLIEGGKGHRIK